MHFSRFMVCGLLLCTSPGLTFSAPGDARVGLVLSEEGGAYRELADSFLARTQQLTKKTDIEVTNVDGAVFDSWRGGGAPQLVVTVGTRAAQAVFDARIGVPTLRVLIARNAHEALLAQAKDANLKTPVTAIYIEQPWLRQFDFVRRVLPKAERFGAILGPASQQDAARITSVAAQQNLMPLLRILTAQEDAGAAFKAIVEQSDVMLAVPDPAVLTPSSAKWLLYTAYQRGIPVVGFSRAYVSAGALGAVFSTPGQIGRQAAEMAARFTQEGLADLGPSIFPTYFSVAINRSVARSLRLDVPDEAELLRKLNAPELPL